MKKNADSNIIPKTAGTYNLGSAANRFKTLYAQDVDITNFPIGLGASWPVTIYGSDVAGTPVYSMRDATFHRIGKMIILRFCLYLSSKGGMSGTVRIGGLPFPAAANGFGMGDYLVYSGINLAAGFVAGGVFVSENTSMLILYKRSNNALLQLTTADIDNSFAISRGTVIYFTN